jgi:hypothetical protein
MPKWLGLLRVAGAKKVVRPWQPHNVTRRNAATNTIQSVEGPSVSGRSGFGSEGHQLQDQKTSPRRASYVCTTPGCAIGSTLSDSDSVVLQSFNLWISAIGSQQSELGGVDAIESVAFCLARGCN